MQIFQLVRPAYFDAFSCKGTECRDTCCRGWSILFSKEEARRVKNALKDRKLLPQDQPLFQKAPPSLKSKHADQAIHLRKDSFCPLLQENGLCSLQAQIGEQLLPYTCRIYPRVFHRYGDTVVQGLSLGCEKVLEVLMEERDGIHIVAERGRLEIPFYTTNISSQLIKSQPVLQYFPEIYNLYLSLLQARDVSIENRLILIGFAVKKIQDLTQTGETNEIPHYLSKYLDGLAVQDINDGTFADLGENTAVLLNCLSLAERTAGLENTGEKNYKNILKRIEEKLEVDYRQLETGEGCELTLHFNAGRYRECVTVRDTFFEGREYFWENLAIGHLFYSNAPFCKSTNVWDNYMYFVWFYSLLKFAITVCIEPGDTEKEIFHDIAVLYRLWAHNGIFQKNAIEEMKKNECDSMAHMTLLLKSC